MQKGFILWCGAKQELYFSKSRYRMSLLFKKMPVVCASGSFVASLSLVER